MERAVIDRFEGELAVLLVGDDEREIVIPVTDLPEGSGPGAWLKVAFEAGKLKEAQLDPETTRLRRSRIQERMNRLLGRRPNREERN